MNFMNYFVTNTTFYFQVFKKSANSKIPALSLLWAEQTALLWNLMWFVIIRLKLHQILFASFPLNCYITLHVLVNLRYLQLAIYINADVLKKKTYFLYILQFKKYFFTRACVNECQLFNALLQLVLMKCECYASLNSYQSAASFTQLILRWHQI